MLPDFLSVKKKRARKFLRFVVNEQHRRTPLLRSLPTIRQHEGRQLTYNTVQGDQVDLSYSRIGADLQIGVDELPLMRNDDYWAKARRMGKDLAEAQMRQFFSVVDQNCEKAGTEIDGSGQPMNAELILKAWSKTDIDFDDEHRPRWPKFVVNPAQAEGLNSILMEALEDSSFRRRLEDLVTEKWMEWCDRESNRKLVD